VASSALVPARVEDASDLIPVLRYNTSTLSISVQEEVHLLLSQINEHKSRLSDTHSNELDEIWGYSIDTGFQKIVPRLAKDLISVRNLFQKETSRWQVMKSASFRSRLRCFYLQSLRTVTPPRNMRKNFDKYVRRFQLADNEIINDFSSQRLLTLFQADLLSFVSRSSAAILRYKASRDMFIAEPRNRTEKRMTSAIFLVVYSGMIAFILLFGLQKPRALQSAILRSLATWVTVDLVIVRTLAVYLLHVAIPSAIIADLAYVRYTIIEAMEAKKNSSVNFSTLRNKVSWGRSYNQLEHDCATTHSIDSDPHLLREATSLNRTDTIEICEDLNRLEVIQYAKVAVGAEESLDMDRVTEIRSTKGNLGYDAGARTRDCMKSMFIEVSSGGRRKDRSVQETDNGINRNKQCNKIVPSDSTPPLNSARFLFVSSRMAQLNPSLPESELISFYSSTSPLKDNRVTLSSCRVDTVHETARKVTLFCTRMFVEASFAFQDSAVSAVLHISMASLATGLLLCYKLSPFLIVVPIIATLILLHLLL